MSQRFELRMPDELMARIDAVRGGGSRAGVIVRALEAALGNQTVVDGPGPGPVQFQETGPASPPASAPPAERTARFRCPNDCDPKFRPASSVMRCPVCRKQVVPA